MNTLISSILHEREENKKNGLVWEGKDSGWCKVVEYEYLNKVSVINKNKLTDECRVTLEDKNKDRFTKVVWDIDGEYFMGNKKCVH
tara:strand:- start:21 stop:278 length:258 start_codon:yes stop_codon:yes gene_type:complete